MKIDRNVFSLVYLGSAIAGLVVLLGTFRQSIRFALFGHPVLWDREIIATILGIVLLYYGGARLFQLGKKG